MCAALLVSLAFAHSALAATWFVNINAPPGGDGTQWSLAFNDLHDALDNPFLLEGDQIWVAAGTYVPTKPSNVPLANTDAFDLRERVRLYGGFAGNETSLGQRLHVGNVFVNETILTSTERVLAGFEIGSGQDDAPGDRTIVNGFTIWGAGVWLQDAAPVFIRCRFIDVMGGQAVFAQGSFAGRAPEFINCEFIGNAAQYGAGVTLFAMFGGNPAFTNCLFHDNVATGQHSGGAIRVVGADAGKIVNCTFFRNQTLDSHPGGGGGVHLDGAGTWTITNAIFWANSVDGQRDEAAQILLDNLNPGSTTLHLNYSIVEGLTGNFGGQGNFDLDPEFISESIPDLRLQAGSPAIDSGRNDAVPGDRYNVSDNPFHIPSRPAPELDLGPRRIINGIVDRGPYEYNPEGDLAGTGSVGWEDMDVLLANHGCEGECLGDFNLDEKVDDDDIVTLLELLESE